MDGLTPDLVAATTSDSDVNVADNLFASAAPEATIRRSQQLDKAITAIITAFGDLDLIARSWSVDPEEVVAELVVVGETSEKIALLLLQKYNPQ